MSDEIYHKLAKVLDTLPNGFPATESGIEIKILKKIFRPEDAELFCELRLTFETPEQISERTGRPLSEIKDRLFEMWKRGQIFGISYGGMKLFKMMPWAFGIYEFQLDHMDKEFAEMCEEFMEAYGRQFFDKSPQLMQVVPIERQIKASHESVTYERVSSIIEAGQSFLVQECICKKEKGLLGSPCGKPTEVCMAIAPIPGIFEKYKVGRVLSKDEAYALLNKCEDAGLVHLTFNVENGHFFICNCCGCCCGVLRSINDLGIPATRVVNSNYFATIDPEKCVSCGLCAEERCQVKAIEEVEDAYRVIKDRCIGCGLCVGTCPSEAITLVRKAPEEIVIPPADEMAWFDERARQRGVDFSAFR